MTGPPLAKLPVSLSVLSLQYSARFSPVRSWRSPMHRHSLVAVLFLVLSLAAGRAEAVTVRDVIELSKAGLSDSVLLAVIDVDRSVFAIDAATLKQLKSAGVSDAVIVAMIRSGREARVDDAVPPVAQEPAPMPDTQEPAPQPA